MLRGLDLVVVGIWLARPTAAAADIAELIGLEVEVAEELLARLAAVGAILPVGRPCPITCARRSRMQNASGAM